MVKIREESSMNLTRCEKGHFYDGEKFPQCPHCGGNAVTAGGVNNDDPTECLGPGFMERMINTEEYINIDTEINKCKSINRYIYALDNEIVSPIVTSVDFYRNSAILKLSVEAQVKAGENILYLSDNRLPSDSSKVHFKFNEGIEDVRVLDKVKVATLKFEAEDKIKEMAERGNMLIDKKNILLHQVDQLSGFLNYKALKDITIDSAIEYLKETEPKLIQAILDELRTLQEQIDIIRKDITGIYYENKKHIHSVLAVMFNSQIEGKMVFEISYEDHSANWIPYYEIHYDNEEKPINFKLRAKIKRTASNCERWEDISVRLLNESTGKTSGIPQITPRHLKYYKKDKKAVSIIEAGDVPVTPAGAFIPEPIPITSPISSDFSDFLPQPSPGMYDSNDEKESTFADFDDDFMTGEDNDDISVYEDEGDIIYNTEVSSVFMLEGKWTFPEVSYYDKRFAEMTLNIQQFDIQAEYSYYAVPLKSKNVFITAKFQKADVDRLIPCRAYIYVHDVMIGDCIIKSRSASNEFILSLGQDDELIIGRKQTQKQHKVSEEDNTQCDLCEFKITVENRKSQNVTIRILDQIPISDDNRIEVVQEELSEGEYNFENGEVKWDVDAEAKGEKEIILRYNIVYRNA